MSAPITAPNDRAARGGDPGRSTDMEYLEGNAYLTVAQRPLPNRS